MEKCKGNIDLEFGVFDSYEIECHLEQNHKGKHEHKASGGYEKRELVITWVD